MHVSEDISASRSQINLPIASLKPCCQAGSFEYNKPYICEYFFFVLKGGRVNFSVTILIPRTEFFKDFDPMSGFYIYRNIDFHLKHNSNCQN